MEFCGDLKAKNGLMEDAIRFEGNVAAIADGHGGHHGAAIATLACNHAVTQLTTIQGEINPDQFYEMMPHMFAEIHNEYLQTFKYVPNVQIYNDVPMFGNQVIRGGSTFAVTYHGVYQERPYIMTANVGDSEVYIFSCKNGVYQAKQLTVTHEPTSEAEYHRIQKWGQQAAHFVYDTKGSTTAAGHLPIFEDNGTMIHYEDTYTPYNQAIMAYQAAWNAVDQAKKAGEPVEELRAILRDVIADYTAKKHTYDHSQDSRRNPSTARGDRGAYIMVDTLDPANSIKLGLTRAIGDYHVHKAGLTHEPYVSVTFLDQEDLGDQAVIFMATDGILDCYHMEQLAEVVLTTQPDQLMKHFCAKEVELFQKAHDDLSFILKKLK